MRGVGRRWAVRVLAWALRHGVTMDQAEVQLYRSFSYRDADWRALLLADALAHNRARVMRSLGA